MIEIYGKPQCPFCDRAKALCEQKGYEYTYKQKFPTARTFPQIVAHGEAIGGFQELEIWSQGYRTV